MEINKLISIIILCIVFPACSNEVQTRALEEHRMMSIENFKDSDSYLFAIYNMIKKHGIKSEIEKEEFLKEQNHWLRERNFFCKLTELENISSLSEQCLIQKNIGRIDYLQNNYLNFERLEKHIINPFLYQNSKKIIDVGGCFCSENSIKILNNKMYIFQTCDQMIENPISLNIISKKINMIDAEYDLDIDQDNIADINVKFTAIGKNAWKISLYYDDENSIININTKHAYTTDSNLEMYEGDCGDFDG